MSWLRREPGGARWARITVLGAAGVALTLAPARLGGVWRDWMPVLLILLFYRQAGEFVTGQNVAFERRLLRLDARLVAPPLTWCARSRLAGLVFPYLEIAYLSYYPVLPLAFGASWLGGAGAAGRFWTVVLLAAYGSCGALPFLQTRPPRALDEKWSAVLPGGKVRAFNLWILGRGSIQANTCPSAHVAVATACALALLLDGPMWLGLVFAWIAFSIALGAVGGRYHYAADAVLGALTALAALAAALALG